METLGHKVTLECRSAPSCPAYGKRRKVPLFVVVEGVLARPGFLCADCHMELMDVSKTEET